MNKSLGVAFVEEQARVRTVLGYYKELGPVGTFGATMIEDLLRRCDRAAMEQDTVVMLRLYEELKEVQS